MIVRPSVLGGARRRALAVLVLLSMGQALAMVGAAFATRDVFIFLRSGQDQQMPHLALLVIALSGLALFACRAMEGRVGEQAGQSYAADMRRALFRHITRMPHRSVARRRSGALALRYVGDLAAFKGWVARGVARLVSASLTIPAALFVLWYIEPWLLLAAGGPLLAVILVVLVLGGPLGQAHADLRSKRAKLAAALSERLPQGIQLRRSGRMRRELRNLDAYSTRVARAGMRRETLAATVRALPDAGAGLATALCLWAAMHLGLSVPDVVAILTALGMIIWPLRHLADVFDRRRAFLVASAKLDRLLQVQRLPKRARRPARKNAPVLRIEDAHLPQGGRGSLLLERGERARLSGPPGSGKTALLLALAGFDSPFKARRFEISGHPPGTLSPKSVLYLGRQSLRLAGSLRRDVTLGLGFMPDDALLLQVLNEVGLAALVARLGGLDGKIGEGRRNLTASEQSRILLARGLLADPVLALVDADEIGFDDTDIGLLLDRFERRGIAALIVTSQPKAVRRLRESCLADGTARASTPTPTAG